MSIIYDLVKSVITSAADRSDQQLTNNKFMKALKLTLTALAIAIATVVPTAYAQETKERTKITPRQLKKETIRRLEANSTALTTSLKQEITSSEKIVRENKVPEPFLVLQKKLESDKELSAKLSKLIQMKNVKDVNQIISESTKSKIQIVYTDPDIKNPVILQFRWYDSNGILHVWPKGRIKCKY